MWNLHCFCFWDLGYLFQNRTQLFAYSLVNEYELKILILKHQKINVHSSFETFHSS